MRIHRLDLVGLDGRAQTDAGRDGVDDFLEDDGTALRKDGGVGQGVDCDVTVDGEDAEVGVTAVRLRDAHDERVRRVSDDELGGDLVVEGRLGLGRVVEEGILVRRRAHGHNQGVLGRMHASNGMSTGRRVDHLAPVESHAGELCDEGQCRILGHRNAQGSSRRRINPSTTDGHDGPATGPDGSIHGDGEQIGDGGAHGEELLQEDEGGREGRAAVLAAARLKHQGRVEASDARRHIGGGHVVEAGADPLGGVDAAGHVWALGAGGHGVGEGAGAVAGREKHDVLELVGRRWPGRGGGEALREKGEG